MATGFQRESGGSECSQPHRYSPSSSHELPMEPRVKVETGPGKHITFNYFPEDRNCDICLKTKKQVLMQKTCWYSRAQSGKWPRITKFSVQNVNPDIIIDTPLWHKIWQLSDYNPTRKPKVIYTDNPLGFGKSCEDLSWNPGASTPHRSETNGIAWSKRRYVCCVVAVRFGYQVWTMNGGRIPWNAAAICENFRIFHLMGNHHVKVGMPFNGPPVIPSGCNGRISPYFCEVHIETTSILSKSLAKYVPRLCIVCGKNLERRHYGRRH